MTQNIVKHIEQFSQQTIPQCPVCEDSSNVSLYGTQQYLIERGRIPSFIYRCNNCNFNFRRFARSLFEVLSHFKVAPYSTDEVEQRWLKRREGFYKFLLDLLPVPHEGKSLLDVGCAFGHFLDSAAERGYRPFGTEVSEEMAELLRKRRNYLVSSRPLTDLQLPEKQFDVITFVDSFYYFENPLETLHQCHKLLKNRGKLLMRVTNRNGMARLHRLTLKLMLQGSGVIQMPFWTTDDAISCHSRQSLIRLMNKTGFRITKLTGIEKGKRIESFGMRTFYKLTTTLLRVTFNHIWLTPGIICLAEKD